MKDRTILKTGVVGTAIAAICCFTPFLVVLLGAVGLSAWLGWLDYVLFPAMAVFMGVAAYGLYLRNRVAGASSDDCCRPAFSNETEQKQ